MSFYEKADAKKMTKQECVVCGHSKQDHIYEEGACRPGFICTANCEKFVALKKDDEYSYEKARDEAAEKDSKTGTPNCCDFAFPIHEEIEINKKYAFGRGADWGYIYGRKASSEEIESLAKEVAELKRKLDIAVEALDDAIRNIYGNDMHPFEVERRMSKALAQISAATEDK